MNNLIEKFCFRNNTVCDSAYDYCVPKQIKCACGHYEYYTKNEEVQKIRHSCPNCNNIVLDCQDGVCLSEIVHNVLAKEFYQICYEVEIVDKEIKFTTSEIILSYYDKLLITYKYGNKEITHQINDFNFEENIFYLNHEDTINIKNKLSQGYIQKQISEFSNLFCKEMPDYVNICVLNILNIHTKTILQTSFSNNLFLSYKYECLIRNFSYLKDFGVLFEIHYDAMRKLQNADNLDEFLHILFNGAEKKAIKNIFFQEIKHSASKQLNLDKYFIYPLVFKNIDNLQTVLKSKKNNIPTLTVYELRVLKDLLQTLCNVFGESAIIKKIVNNRDFFGEYIEDTLLMYTRPISPNFTNIKFDTLNDIHDEFIMARHCYINQKEHCKDFQYTNYTKNLIGSYGGFDFILPKTPKELTEWGREHRNCLATRIDCVLSGNSIIVGILKDKKHILNAEISIDFKIIEVKGFANRHTATEENIVILEHLKNVKDKTLTYEVTNRIFVQDSLRNIFKDEFYFGGHTIYDCE